MTRVASAKRLQTAVTSGLNASRPTAERASGERSTVARGQSYEAVARAYLESQGLVWIASNHRCRFGEIDLIMSDQERLVFIEVRFRRSSGYGGASASVDARKQRRLVTAARHYLSRCPTERPCRFDVIAINGQESIRWIKGAFDASD